MTNTAKPILGTLNHKLGEQMNTITTDIYPTRYAEHNKTFIIANDKKRQGGYEWAILKHPMQNLEYPHIEDGIYIEIVSYQDTSLLLKCYACVPNATRKDISKTVEYKYEEFDRALAKGWRWYMEVLAIINQTMKSTEYDIQY